MEGRRIEDVKMPFKRNLELFTIVPEDVDFPAILRSINGLPRNATPQGRIQEGEGFAIALKDYTETPDSCEGIIVRLRTDDIPVKGNLISNLFQQIPLHQNEGLAEMTFFFYWKKYKVLCLLPAKNGVKWGTFSYYIQQKSGLRDFNLNMLLSADAARIYRSFRSITSILAEVRIANDSGPSSRQVASLPLGIAADTARRAGVTRLKVELYNPKKKGGLVANAARIIGDAFKNLSGATEPEHIIVKGSTDPNISDQVVDLISQKFSLPIILGNSGGRSLDFNECRNLVRQKILEREQTIKDLLS